jgi:signal transduction histidine kinase
LAGRQARILVCSRIIKDVTRASDIISRIGLLFKKGTPQRELLDVNEVIQEMIALLRHEASRYSIAIRGELASNLPDQLFKAFFTTKPQGTGMGLTISHSIVESQGGRLWATACSGRGATFQFTLPGESAAHQAALGA